MQVVQSTLERGGIRESQGNIRAQDSAACWALEALVEGPLQPWTAFPVAKEEVVNYGFAEAAARRTAPTDDDQVDLVESKGKMGRERGRHRQEGQRLRRRTRGPIVRVTSEGASTATGRVTSSPTVPRRKGRATPRAHRRGTTSCLGLWSRQLERTSRVTNSGSLHSRSAAASALAMECQVKSPNSWSTAAPL